MKAVLAHLSQSFNATARKSLTPSPRNMRNNGTTGYKAVWHHKPYFMKVVKKNGKWVQDPSNKKYYIKNGNRFVAPEYVSYW
jgi:hypothetical protein